MRIGAATAVAAVAVVTVAATGCGTNADVAVRVPSGTLAVTRVGRPTPRPRDTTSYRVVGVWTPPAPRVAPVARPTVLRIPSLDILAPMVPLGLTAAGELDVPESEEVAGWWTGGSTPGRAGPTVVVGHVDSDRRPGVFQHLRELGAGDAVELLREDGSAVRYLVDRVEQRAKADFPTGEVYGGTSASTLRLITCGGDFDRRSRHYLDNVIVFAELAGADSSG